MGNPLPRASQEPRGFAWRSTSHRCPGLIRNQENTGGPSLATPDQRWEQAPPSPQLALAWHLSSRADAFPCPDSPSAYLGRCPLPLTFPYQKPDCRLQLSPRGCGRGAGGGAGQREDGPTRVRLPYHTDICSQFLPLYDRYR